MAKTNMKSESDWSYYCGPRFLVPMLLALIILPFLLIWALNTLFSTNIAYNAFTWLAALVIVVLLSGKGMRKQHFFGGCNCYCTCNSTEMKK